MAPKNSKLPAIDIVIEKFSLVPFHPVIKLPREYEIYDFSQGYDPGRTPQSEFGIGKFNEQRPGMYTSELFGQNENHRDIHMGVDIGAPVGTEVHAFYEGSVFCSVINSAAGDYGGTLITEHSISNVQVWALHGHLSHASVARAKKISSFAVGETLGWVGDKTENGGWNPHLHFQLSLERPLVCDMPGAVARNDLQRALDKFLDPRLVLGKIY